MAETMYRFSIDRGGTFTDVYAEVPGDPGFRVVKLLSENPAHYPDAPLEGIRRILQDVSGIPLPMEKFDTSRVEWVRMGTTVATNALLERKGEPCALLITKGFGDLLRIGKQNRPDLFDLKVKKPDPLYETIVEVEERVRVVDKAEGREDINLVQGISGDLIEILQAPDLDRIEKDLQPVLERGIRSLAVVLMHSWTWPDHELQIGALAEKMGFAQVSLSSRVMPRVKIVERGQTCCVAAYLTPAI
ncbi:MAG: 5-oxoprolinase, partial [Nitrospinae bacterium]|nr:5-oxoprolinase [Nitrospinota bacterium]